MREVSYPLVNYDKFSKRKKCGEPENLNPQIFKKKRKFLEQKFKNFLVKLL
jgi:hypothetical protein